MAGRDPGVRALGGAASGGCGRSAGRRRAGKPPARVARRRRRGAVCAGGVAAAVCAGGVAARFAPAAVRPWRPVARILRARSASLQAIRRRRASIPTHRHAGRGGGARSSTRVRSGVSAMKRTSTSLVLSGSVSICQEGLMSQLITTRAAAHTPGPSPTGTRCRRRRGRRRAHRRGARRSSRPARPSGRDGPSTTNSSISSV